MLTLYFSAKFTTQSSFIMPRKSNIRLIIFSTDLYDLTCYPAILSEHFSIYLSNMKFFVATSVPKILSLCLVNLILFGCAEEPTVDLSEPHSKFIVKPKRTYEYPIHPLTGTYAHSPAVKQFIQHMTNTHAFDEGYLNDLFSQAHRLNYVIRLEGIPHASGPKSNKPSIGGWTRYRKQFLTEGHIDKGVNFWLENSDAIQRASQTYNVDPEYIVAIIGVETYFGRNFGTTPKPQNPRAIL